VAPVYPPMWTHWRHLANTIELVLPSAHPSPQPKWQIDRFSCFCTAYGRKSLYFTMGGPSPKIAPYRGQIWTPSNSWFLGPVRAYNPKGITISSAVFTQVTARCHVLYNGPPVIPQLPFPMGDLYPNLIHGSLGLPESSTQTPSRLVQPFCRAQ